MLIMKRAVNGDMKLAWASCERAWQRIRRRDYENHDDIGEMLSRRNSFIAAGVPGEESRLCVRHVQLCVIVRRNNNKVEI